MDDKMSIDPKEIKNYITEHEETLRRYVALLIKANESMRLTGPSDEETLWNGHILDCASAIPLLPKGANVIDVGTGGGLPGIVFAICRPDIRVTLLDSMNKKCVQTEKITALLGLKNTSVVCERSEDYEKKTAGRFDAAAARAVCAAGILTEYLSPFVKVGGRLIAYKGPKAQEEIDEVGDKWNRLGLSRPTLIPYPLGDIVRLLVVWDKKSPLPKGMPRRPGMAEKFPWYRQG